MPMMTSETLKSVDSSQTKIVRAKHLFFFSNKKIHSSYVKDYNMTRGDL